MTEMQGAWPPGLMVSAPASGTGKTTVMLGLLRALADDGLKVQPFKSGPDYIDPAFHRAASGRASFNLETWAMGQDLFSAIAHHATGADICLAEGSMGLFDGVATRGLAGFGSSAETAGHGLAGDPRARCQRAGAVGGGHGARVCQLRPGPALCRRDPEPRGQPRHERLTRAGMDRAGLPVLGVLPRRGDLTLPERHLGLIQAVEHPDLDAAIAGYAEFLRDACRSGGDPRRRPGWPAPGGGRLPAPPAQRIALAQDAAFSFTYPHILAGWRAAGAEILPFSPLADEAPDPSADLVWLPGGYPELHAGSSGRRKHVPRRSARPCAKRPVHGECGGYMALGAALIDKEGCATRWRGCWGWSPPTRRASSTSAIAARCCPRRCRATRRARPCGGTSFTIAASRPARRAACRVADADGNPVPETGSRRGHVTGTFFHLIAEETP